MNSKTAKTSKGIIRKSARFIAPGQLAKDRGYGQKASKVAHGTKRLRAEEQEAPCNFNRRRINGISAHTLFVHFGEDKWEERDFTEESSFLDVLNIANKFIDIYSIGVKIVDGDGKPLRNDQDLLTLLREQDDVENIELYLDVDETAQPLLFKLPQDNLTSASVPTQGGQGVDPRPDPTEQNVEEKPESKKTRKVRGKNKNKKIAGLQAGKKLEIEFYNNRGVGVNHKCWSRHLGKIVRDKNICPIRVKTWKEVTEQNKQHMWDWVKECFSNPNIELYRGHTLEHMDSLWSAWRSSLNVKYVKPCKTKAEALKNVPQGMDDKDWEWLVNNKFLTDEFQKASAQNSNNRVNGVMPHRTGSKPHRHIIYEMGGKVDDPLDIAKIFYETRQKNGKFVEEKAQEKYDEILKIVHANASLSPLAVVETCFGPQSHSRIFGFGGGMKRKHFNDSHAAHGCGMKRKFFNDSHVAHIKQHEAKLHENEEENNILNQAAHIKELEAKLHENEDENNILNQVAHIKELEAKLHENEEENNILNQAAHIKELEVKLREKEEENKILKRRMDRFEERLARMENDNQQVSHAPPTCADGHE